MNRIPSDPRGSVTVDLATEPDFAVGTLLVRPASREVTLDGRVEMIEPRVMQALIVLARQAGEVVSRDQLVAACWSGRVVTDDAVNRCIAKVRQLASPRTFSVETIPRVGYRLIPAHPAASVPVSPSGRKWKVIQIAAVVAALLVAASGFWTWRLMQRFGASSPWELGALMSAGQEADVAVLAFDAEGDGADIGYVATAIPTAVNTQLIALGFRSVSLARSFQYRGERKAQAAAELGARYLIDGSVRLEGTTLRVTARVDSPVGSVSVWSRDFTADGQATSQLSSRIATEIASLAIFRTLGRAPISSSPAVVAAMMGIEERGRAGDAMGAYEFASERARDMPNVFAIQAYYAITAAAVLDRFPAQERASVLASARNAAKRAAAVSLTGAPVAVQAVMPAVDWNAREQVLRAGLAADAPSPRNQYTLAMLLAHAGRITEAKAIARAAAAVDPFLIANVLAYARILDSAGDREEADLLIARAARLWPDTPGLAVLQLAYALTRASSQSAQTVMSDLSEPLYQTIVSALSSRDRAAIDQVVRACAEPAALPREARDVCLRALLVLAGPDGFFAAAPAYYPSQLGSSPAERDERWLADPEAWRNLHILFHVEAAALRTDERFIPIVRRMGLIDYWRATGNWPDFCQSEPASVCERMRAM